MTVEAKALMMRDAVDDFMMEALVVLYWNNLAGPFCLDCCAMSWYLLGRLKGPSSGESA
jgi:hypothetical protein